MPLLDAKAQQAMGQLRPDLEHIKTLLNTEGFARSNYISIFDGGPTLEADTDSIATIQNQFSCSVQIREAEACEQTATLISNNRLKHFVAIQTTIDLNDIYLTPIQAERLDVQAGDTVFVLPLASS